VKLCLFWDVFSEFLILYTYLGVFSFLFVFFLADGCLTGCSRFWVCQSWIFSPGVAGFSFGF